MAMNPGDHRAVPSSAPPPLSASSRASQIATKLQRITSRSGPVVIPITDLQLLENPSRTKEQEDAALQAVNRFRLEARERVGLTVQLQNHLCALIQLIDQHWPPAPAPAVNQSASRSGGREKSEANPSSSKKPKTSRA